MFRRTLPSKIRTQIRNRDGKRCTRCQTEENLVVHHILPVSEGGTNDPENLQLVCMVCHKAIHEERGDWYADLMTNTLEEMAAATAPRRRVTIYQDGLLWLTQQNLSATTMRVLFYLLTEVEGGNYLRMTNTSIAAALGCPPRTVTTAMRCLASLSVVWRWDKHYRLNPLLAWKGSPTELAIARSVAERTGGVPGGHPLRAVFG